MKNRQKNFVLIVGMVVLSFLYSCTKNKGAEPVKGYYPDGAFIINEGPYGTGVGTISHFDKITKVTTNNIFEKENGFSLGNIVQSMYIHNGKAYIVVNNANKIEVAKDTTFKSLTTVSGLNQPRYFLPVSSNKAYITEWGADGLTGAIKVFDLNSNTITSSIATGKGAENMLKVGDYVYVTCKGGLGNDEVINVIDIVTNSVVKTITVGANPANIVQDVNGKIWVLCSGKYKSDYSELEKTGSLIKIDPVTNTIELTLAFTSKFSQPAGLSINKAKDKLFYNYDGKVYSHEISANSLSATGVINRSFYGLGIDPGSDIIYGADAGNFSSSGKVIRYQSNGTVIDSMNVGIIPNGFFFK